MRFRLLAAWLMTLSGLGCAGGIATSETEDVGGRDNPPSRRDDPGPGREVPPSTREVPPPPPAVLILVGTASPNPGGGAGAGTPSLDGGASE